MWVRGLKPPISLTDVGEETPMWVRGLKPRV